MASHQVSAHPDRSAGPATLSLEATLIATVAPLMRHLRATVMTTAEWNGLTFGHYGVLELLSRCGPQRPRAMGRHLGVKAPVVTRLLKTLIQRELVRREADPADARSVLVTLTATGERRVRAMHADVLAAASQLVRPLPPSARRAINLALEDLQVLTAPLSGGIGGA